MDSSLFDITRLEPLIREGCVLLTPNQRLARRIKTEWDRRQAQAGAGTWPRLEVYPVERWLLECWQRAVAQERLPPRLLLGVGPVLELWRQVIQDDEERGGSYHLLRPADAAAIAQQARDVLCRWQVNWRAGPVRAEFERDPDCRVFLAWLEAFEEHLERADHVTVEDCIQELLRLDPDPAAPRVALVECDELPPLQAAALEHLASAVGPAPAAARSAGRLLHPFPDQRAELQAVAAWAASTMRQDPEQTLGIVLGDAPARRVALEYLLRREFACLGDDYDTLPVNFSAGIPLSHAPLVRDAFAVLSIGAGRIRVSAVGALLRSRFLDLPDADSALAQKLLQHLHTRGREYVSLSDLRYQASEIRLGELSGLVLGQYLREMSRMEELNQHALPSVWADRFSSILDLWGWPGGTLDSLEYQQTQLWVRTLDDYRGFDAVCGPMDFPSALGLLRNSCERQVSHPQTVDANVQVLGPLEAAGLYFDHLWLVGMQASAWPAPARPNPFLPLRLQARLDTPHATAEREWVFAETRLAQYLRNCDTVHASYSHHIEGVPDLPSPLLQTFAERPLETPPAVPRDWSDRRQAGKVVQVVDTAGPPLAPDALTVGGSGLLEDQSHCPFRAFARWRLQVEPLGEFGVALSAADRGNLLHRALCGLWAELRDHSGLAALGQAAEQALIGRAVESAVELERRRAGFGLGPAYWELESERLAGLLASWLKVERQRSAFVVAGLEQEAVLRLARLELRLRVDRVDELEDGSRFIIDYKSSKSRVADWLGERPRKPQLLLYGIAEPQEPAALAFAQVRPEDCRFVGLGRIEAAPGIKTDLTDVENTGITAEHWQALNGHWRNILERLAQEFVAGVAGVAPLAPDSCTWCGLQPLCRIEQNGIPVEVAE